MANQTQATRDTALALLKDKGMNWTRTGKGQRVTLKIERGDETLSAVVKVASLGAALVRTSSDDPETAEISGFTPDVDHVLFAVTTKADPNVSVYLVPLGKVEVAYRATHAAWMANKPTRNSTTTWVLHFDDKGEPEASGFATKWAEHLVGTAAAPAEGDGAGTGGRKGRKGAAARKARAEAAAGAGVGAAGQSAGASRGQGKRGAGKAGKAGNQEARAARRAERAGGTAPVAASGAGGQPGLSLDEARDAVAARLGISADKVRISSRCDLR